MKTLKLLVVATFVSVGSLSFAQTGAPSGAVLHSYTGLVTGLEVSSNTISLSKGDNIEPVSYVYSDNTRFVDAAGNPIDVNTITSDTVVKVDYTMVGNARQVQQIVVNPQPEPTGE